ncbi:hypothetical protein [Actinoplanes couchii]|uniref:2-keto-4-pentenoate hydratase n=1 Tax=Actinoplanes couchii TaxID=403638 RepID=A0ABQ3X7B5_9ACTN|nr:hypothetical protein [Actinoplanes couchii]MDR6322135.1 hypothetical protein [Actinoplanes couchii]GID54300.1 hypothetical protein Aco03nite_027040 [Actinoplanes couchii]
MISPVEPWSRPAHRPTGREAAVMLVAFTGGEVLTGMDLTGAVPAAAPVGALDVRLHHWADNPGWIDGWRTGPLRALAERELPDATVLDAATSCYTIQLTVADPSDLTHLQLAWAVAAEVCRAGAVAVLDAYAHDWYPAPKVAELDPHRPFTVMREISVVAEADPVPGFGHPVHTRGMAKFGRPDLITGIAAEQVGEAAGVLNQLASRLAEGHVLAPGQQIRVGRTRTLTVEPYVPGDRVPDVGLIADGLLLAEV